ncbi:MAG: hypothetical protein ABI986_09180 [Chloroflexota bacterium]
MAKVLNNLVMQGLSGSLGNQLVIRKGKGGQTIITAKPAAGRNFNPTQLAHQQAFRDAIAYAKSARDEVTYLTKAQGTTMSAFNAAVADWFRQPEVLEIDPSAWTGAIGQVIRVKAQDDTLVASVKVVIDDGQGGILEQGNAVQANGLWWEYTTTTLTEVSTSRVTATAKDLPGNNGTLVWQDN